MNQSARHRVLTAIRHEEPDVVPYEMRMEPSVAARLDAYHGSGAWRDLLDNDIRRVRSYSSGSSGPGAGGSDRIDDERHVGAATWLDAYGTLWRRAEGAPRLERPALTESDPDALELPSMDVVFESGWRRKALETIRAYRDHYLITGIDFGVQDRTLLLRGYEAGLTDIAADESRAAALMARVTDHFLDVVDVVSALDIDGIMFGDDWGDQRGLVIGPDRWRRLIKPQVARLIDRIHTAGKIAMIHCCGNCSEILPDLIEIGLDVLESIQPEAMDPYVLKRTFGSEITFWGGLGSQTLIPFGTPAQIKDEVRRLVAEMGTGGGYILSPAKTFMADTPTENAAGAVEAFLETR